MNNMKNNDPFKFPNSQSYSKLSLLSLPSSTSSCNNDANLSISNFDSQPHSQSQSNQSLLIENSEQSPINEMIRTAKLNAPLVIKRGPRGYGFTLRAIKVYFDDSDFYTIQHLVIQLDPQGPAFSSGLRLNDIITHVNDENSVW
jgi:S1-C subfamily serine protease